MIDNSTTSLIFGVAAHDNLITVSTANNDEKVNMFGEAIKDGGTNTMDNGLLTLDGAATFDAAVTDGNLGGLIFRSVVYTATGSDKIARHNYIILENPNLLASAAVTDACVLAFT